MTLSVAKKNVVSIDKNVDTQHNYILLFMLNVEKKPNLLTQ